jgi:hypothetical protein
MIGPAVRRRVRDRAGDGCEYCGTRQADEPFVGYQIEHIIAIQHGGSDDEEKLALACSHCNLHKGPNLAGIDPDTGALEALFHPRRQIWAEHFKFQSVQIEGRTPTGRATISVLAMNARVRLDLRREVEAGRNQDEA